eukprot:CAMPEP_0115854926 /NCGR_PEP_ID=MMETSP0287-20121206/14280_1 /TAXON_ID=412157 /ORGANISM="Chrysochromulina rotalis, Strain UIO044" /LENGTH=147 /DNA_ID=CAMNT_0003309067 /DNA_START=159 /DNA_END=602 /DNA_ORIENTATION=-
MPGSEHAAAPLAADGAAADAFGTCSLPTSSPRGTWPVGCTLMTLSADVGLHGGLRFSPRARPSHMLGAAGTREVGLATVSCAARASRSLSVQTSCFFLLLDLLFSPVVLEGCIVDVKLPVIHLILECTSVLKLLLLGISLRLKPLIE